MQNRAKPFAFASLLFALLGGAFSIVSTYDFINHLDRQVHSIHCSVLPGAGVDAAGASGCHAVMMSPYSSLFRTSLWGGIPISLLALGVFAYLAFRGVDILARNASGDPAEGRFLTAANALPLLMTLTYGSVSFFIIEAVCTNCVGIYVASIGGFLSALLMWRSAVKAELYNEVDDEGYDAQEPVGRRYALYFLEGVVFVLLPLIAFLALRPDYSTAIADCGEMPAPDDRYGVLVPLSPSVTGSEAIEVLDPLCPACRAFDDRLAISGLKEDLNLKALLFPLDSTCNWMVSTEIHPGACMVSEAVLCAGDDAPQVIEWAFNNQDTLKALAKDGLGKLKTHIVEVYPSMKRCVGSPGARQKLNKALRYAVNNRLPVLTPQLYVEGEKLCDEDTDLGLEYALSQMLGRGDGLGEADIPMSREEIR